MYYLYGTEQINLQESHLSGAITYLRTCMQVNGKCCGDSATERRPSQNNTHLGGKNSCHVPCAGFAISVVMLGDLCCYFYSVTLRGQGLLIFLRYAA